MCFDGSVNAGASETGVTTCTDGRVDAHETPWMVVVVGFPAVSLSVTVTSNGAPPGQVTGTHASVLIAVTAAVPTQLADPPSATQRLLTPAPSEEGRFAASADVVRPHTVKRPCASSCVGPKNCPAVGWVTVKFGAAVSTGKVSCPEVPVIPARFRHVAPTWYVPSGESGTPKVALPPLAVAFNVAAPAGVAASLYESDTGCPSSALVVTTKVTW